VRLAAGPALIAQEADGLSALPDEAIRPHRSTRSQLIRLKIGVTARRYHYRD
jgi:hypothetical protein